MTKFILDVGTGTGPGTEIAIMLAALDPRLELVAAAHSAFTRSMRRVIG